MCTAPGFRPALCICIISSTMCQLVRMASASGGQESPPMAGLLLLDLSRRTGRAACLGHIPVSSIGIYLFPRVLEGWPGLDPTSAWTLPWRLRVSGTVGVESLLYFVLMSKWLQLCEIWIRDAFLFFGNVFLCHWLWPTRGGKAYGLDNLLWVRNPVLWGLSCES